MKVSREQVAANRRRILGAAGWLFRARGFDAVTVAQVMQAAGLTHGGFYGYFKSKDDLIAQTLADVLTLDADRQVDIARYAKTYLSSTHRDDLAGGCPTAALSADTIRQSPEARAAMTEGLRRQIDLLGQGDPAKRQAAIGSWAAMVGAVILARASDDPELSDEMLNATRTWITETR